ncbi:MAG: ABC transporter ATP-binding protein [Planctomycetota bacterium]
MGAVVTERLTKIYRRGVVGVVDLDLRVAPGDTFGFVGPNASGKTTTIRLLMDLLRPTRGRAEILGLDTRRQSMEVRRRVGFLPGDLVLYDDLTGRQTLRLFARLRPGREPSLRDTLLMHLDFPEEALDRRVATYSTGMRQKIGLTVALQHDPVLAILDEPTTGLDPLVRRSFHDTIRQWLRPDRTLFLSSHDIAEVEALCRTVCVLRQGRVVAHDTTERLKEGAGTGASLEDAILSHYRRP